MCLALHIGENTKLLVEMRGGAKIHSNLTWLKFAWTTFNNSTLWPFITSFDFNLVKLKDSAECGNIKKCQTRLWQTVFIIKSISIKFPTPSMSWQLFPHPSNVLPEPVLLHCLTQGTNSGTDAPTVVSVRLLGARSYYWKCQSWQQMTSWSDFQYLIQAKTLLLEMRIYHPLLIWNTFVLHSEMKYICFLRYFYPLRKHAGQFILAYFYI